MHNDMNKNDYIKAMQIVKQEIDKMPTTTSTNIDTIGFVTSNFLSSLEERYC